MRTTDKFADQLNGRRLFSISVSHRNEIFTYKSQMSHSFALTQKGAASWASIAFLRGST
jgi:hypothetical protein